MSGDALIKTENEEKLVTIKGNSSSKPKSDRLKAAKKIFSGKVA